MTCTIRYYRPGLPEDAGLLIAKKVEFAAYKARLEAAGYVLLDNPVALPPAAPVALPLATLAQNSH